MKKILFVVILFSLLLVGQVWADSVDNATDLYQPIITRLSTDPSGNSGWTLAGTGLTAGTVYAYDASGFVVADASDGVKLPAICVANSTTTCMYSGVYKFGSSQSWTSGDVLYVSDVTPGAIKNTVPTTAGHFIQRIGVALTNDTLLIMPSLDVGGL